MIDLGAAREEITRSQYIENLVEAASGNVQAQKSTKMRTILDAKNGKGTAKEVLSSGDSGMVNRQPKGSGT